MYPSGYWQRFVGQKFGYKYLLREFLGSGSFGAVFKADEIIQDRIIQKVAIKIIIADQASLNHQIDELHFAVSLKHPNLVSGITHEQVNLNGDLYLGLVMELSEYSLDQFLKSNPSGKLSLEQIQELLEHLVLGLQFIHKQGIVHRDLKPANILRVGQVWKLSDFGIARLIQDRSKTFTIASHQIGSQAYMSPESYDGEISFAWDFWSLGVILAELLTGSHPFPFNSPVELMKKVMMNEPLLSEDLTFPWRNIIEGCLVKNPKYRWQAHQILHELNNLKTVDNALTLLANQSNYFMETGHYKKAIEMYEKMIEISPENFHDFTKMEIALKKTGSSLLEEGKKYYNLGRYNISWYFLKKSIDIPKRRPLSAYLYLAKIHALYDDMNAAINYLDSVLKLYPKKSEALYLKGVFLLRLGHFDEGADFCEKAVIENKHEEIEYYDKPVIEYLFPATFFKKYKLCYEYEKYAEVDNDYYDDDRNDYLYYCQPDTYVDYGYLEDIREGY